MKSKVLDELITIERLNERGYGVGTHEGKEIQILNVLPGEVVKAMVFKRKKDVLYATAEEIVKKSENRIEPKEDHFLACSPWQILTNEAELKTKKDLITNFYGETGYDLGDFNIISSNQEKADSFGYRNKVEYSFYGYEDETLEFAFFKREGNKGKYPHRGCILANEKMNQFAGQILQVLNQKKIRAKELKTLLLRYSNHQDRVVAALFVKSHDINLSQEDFDEVLIGSDNSFSVIFSNPKSPASVVNEVLFSSGATEIVEKILNLKLKYDLTGFFQVNPPLFEKALEQIRSQVENISSKLNKKPVILDLYSGVGTIGLGLANLADKVIGVEVYPGSQEKAMENAVLNQVVNFEFIETEAEKATENISEADIVVVDPPRVGLHQKVLDKIMEVKPKSIIYLSCNPQTQAENLSILREIYKVDFFEAYNFYPNTPHIESLAVLSLKD